MPRRRWRKENETDWDAIATLMYLDGMTEEEELNFIWSHPEIISRYLGPAVTEGERRYLPRIYEREL